MPTQRRHVEKLTNLITRALHPPSLNDPPPNGGHYPELLSRLLASRQTVRPRSPSTGVPGPLPRFGGRPEGRPPRRTALRPCRSLVDDAPDRSLERGDRSLSVPTAVSPARISGVVSVVSMNLP